MEAFLAWPTDRALRAGIDRITRPFDNRDWYLLGGNLVNKHFALLVLTIFAALLASCAPAPVAASPTAAPTQPEAPEATLSPVPPTEAGATAAADSHDGVLRLIVAPEGNEARFRVREQLVSLTLPSDAVGKTTSVSGVIVLQADGLILADESRFAVDLTTLRSDSDRRDGYIQRNTLETGTYPEAVFVPTSVTGLPSPLPDSGAVAFQLIGDLTVHGVTLPVTWDVAAQIEGQRLLGTAVTSITFTEFGMTLPRVGPVLSVEDLIALELDFALILE
jgi:polyisoprenoid-binding protein YceI